LAVRFLSFEVLNEVLVAGLCFARNGHDFFIVAAAIIF